jgi:hypothetical protein
MTNHQSAAAPPTSLPQGRYEEICRHRRNERVHKLKKLRAKNRFQSFRCDDSSSHSRILYWSPHSSSTTAARIATGNHDWFLPTSSSSSDSENGDPIIETSNLTRKERNRMSAKASRDKKNHEIETLSKKIESLENENKDLISFLSRLPQSVLVQLQDSDHGRQLLPSFLEFA